MEKPLFSQWLDGRTVKRRSVWKRAPANQETVSNGILALERKGLIDLDYNLPLQNFDYGPYAAWSRQGSMALTVRGQEVLDVLDIQGVENEDEE